MIHDIDMIAKPWRHRGHLTKEAFQITLARHKVTCSAKDTLDLRRTAAVHHLQHMHWVQALERVA
jgi:hypothetical protein